MPLLMLSVSPDSSASTETPTTAFFEASSVSILFLSKVFCAKAYDACSYEAFPCVPSPRFWVEMRNTATLRDGFKAAP